MKRFTQRLVLIAAATAAVVSCDSRLPTVSRRAAAGKPPAIVVDSPTVNTQVNLGDSIFVVTQITGGNALKTLTLRADALNGVKDLGTFAETPRFATVTVQFPPGTRDTTIRRYLKVLDSANHALDSLVIVAVATDSIGLVDSSLVRATLVSGPHVTIESPVPNDSVPAGVGISISAHAIHPNGIGRIQIHVTGDPTWPTKLDTIMTAVYDGSSTDVTFTGVALIPVDAPQRTRIVINASSVNTNRQPGSAAPIALFIRSNASIPAPRVTQVVPTRSERTDTIQITATGQGIVSVGYIITDSSATDPVVDSNTVALPLPITSNVHVGIPLRLTIAQQGRHLAVTAFAIDQVGRIGYAVRATLAGSETVRANAVADSTEVVYGQTYTIPLPGVVGDVAVDVSRGNVFMSNTSHNRLEVFSNGTRKFDPNGIAVGSLPWGMTQTAASNDTLLVANSGGTNISKVCIGNCGGVMHEDLPHRILTRDVFIFRVNETKDPSTGKITLSVPDPISFSDRPQYVAQSETGRIFYSTRPTPTAKDGTIRWLDPRLVYPAPDPIIIHNYALLQTGTNFNYAIFNIDSVHLVVAPPNSALSDGLYMYDHPRGQLSGVICVNPPPVAILPCRMATTDGSVGGTPDFSVEAAIATMSAQLSDIDAVLRLDVTTLGLTDTTFVASSVNRKWIAFGEGNTPGKPGRVMMTADSLAGLPPPGAVSPQFFSPQVTVSDLTDNASERVFGLALDSTGNTVASHGLQSYFSEVSSPFHLRLQGKYDSFDDGAGVALHPFANGRNSPANQRLAFVGAASGKIEIVDIAYFINRGSLTLKYPIYGPLRVSQRMPTDDPSVILKLFAITQRGLVVIDLTAADIKPGPP